METSFDWLTFYIQQIPLLRQLHWPKQVV